MSRRVFDMGATTCAAGPESPPLTLADLEAAVESLKASCTLHGYERRESVLLPPGWVMFQGDTDSVLLNTESGRAIRVPNVTIIRTLGPRQEA